MVVCRASLHKTRWHPQTIIRATLPDTAAMLPIPAGRAVPASRCNIAGFDRVWIATRLDIAHHWYREHHQLGAAWAVR
jgi:hypothetical protein